MRKTFILFVLVFCSAGVFAQTNLQSMINQLKPGTTPAANLVAQPNKNDYQVRLGQLFNLQNQNKAFAKSFTVKTNYGSNDKVNGYPDTLIIGAYPYDSITITGTFVHTGPIFVALNGILRIKNANVTNLGDIYVFNNGKIFIDSSTVSFPQSYFYERSITLLNKGYISISNTTLMYGGYSHNFVVTDTAQAVFKNVTQPDWMTTGLSGRASLTMNGTNQAGEFIIMDYSNFVLKNATDAILWHQFPDTSVINYSFGKSDTAYGYHFNNTVPGVKGIEYNVTVDSVYDVMWSMLPSGGSNVTINNSKIRSIGVMFDAPKDSVLVSGITDNATYMSTFITPLADRNLTFTNCTVQTWSFYVFHKSIINVTGCIAGEIGAYNSSKVYGNNYVVDGSGGYHYASDTSFILANALTATTTVRSEKNGFFIMGYSTVGNAGNVESIGSSLMLVSQTLVPSKPKAIESSDLWFDFINQPGAIFADSIAPIFGSAWIDRGPSSNWMYFKSWQLSYQKVNDTGWINIAGPDTNEADNSLLANWDTHGLTPGNYLLKLTIHDSWGNNLDAELMVNLLDRILGVSTISATVYHVSVYPNPAQNEVNISFVSGKNEQVSIELTDITGKNVLTNRVYNSVTGNNTVQLNTSNLFAGTYICRILTPDGSVQKVLIKK